MANRYDETVLLAYVEGELTDAQRQTVDQWIAADPRLGKLLSAMQADREALLATPEPEAPAWLMDDIDSDLERSMLLDDGPIYDDAAENHQRHAMSRAGMGLAVAAMVLIAGGIVIYSVIAVDSDQRSMPKIASDMLDIDAPIDTTSDDQAAPADPTHSPIADSTRPHANNAGDPNDLTDPAANTGVSIADSTVPTVDSHSSPPVRPTPEQVVWQVAGVERRGNEQRFVLRLKTTDLDQSVKQLDSVAGSIADAQLRPTAKPHMPGPDDNHVFGVPTGHTPEPDDHPLAEYELTLPADQVDNAVAKLREELPQEKHQVALEKPDGTETDVAQAQPVAPSALTAASLALPGAAPDYAAILSQQVPLDAIVMTPTPLSQQPPVVHATVSVIIERLWQPPAEIEENSETTQPSRDSSPASAPGSREGIEQPGR